MTTGNPTVEEATHDARGGRLQGQDAPSAADPAHVGRVIGQSPAAGTRALDRRHGHDRRRHRPERGHADPDADPDAMRVAVLAGGRSSEHDVSLNSAAAVREGVAAAGPRGAAGDDRALRRLDLRAARRCRCARRRPARRRRRLPGPARPVRGGRDAAGPAGAARRALRRRGRARVLAVHGQGRLQGGAGRRGRAAGALRGRAAARWRAEPEAVLRELAVLGTPVFVKPARLGSSVGIAKVWSEAELGPRARRRLRPRLPGDRRGLLGRAWRSSARCSASASPRRRSRARSSSPAPTGTTTRPSTRRRRDGARRPRPAGPEPVLEEVRRLAVRHVRARRLLRPGAGGLLRRGRRARAGQRAQHAAGLHEATSVFPKLWEAAGLPFPELCDRLLALALERFEPERSVAF